ncbi:MAG TPA: hypothetical protein PKC67_06495 [Kiritimatiellia bacterium]|nr:hypothetical protein [Kiritimatiellia bacterium]HMP33984.1 hypothetical protein [Kiritimatiellia bacterium]
MLTCKQVSNALARKDYAAMSPLERLGLRIHIALCAVCGRYNRQVMIMQDAARAFRRRENAQIESSGACLSCCDKDAIKNAIRQRR